MGGTTFSNSITNTNKEKKCYDKLLINNKEEEICCVTIIINVNNGMMIK